MAEAKRHNLAMEESVKLQAKARELECKMHPFDGFNYKKKGVMSV